MTTHATYWPGRVRAAFAEAIGEQATVDEGFGPVSVDVPAARWADAVELARDGLDCTFFDWLSAVDELTDGFRVVCHLADHRPRGVEHLVLRTLVPRDEPVVASVVHLFPGARWHERETHEMFGVEFTDPAGERLALDKLLLPENFEGHPLRKDFILASRVAKPWPGAKEPGESDHQAAAPSRRRTRPPGVPEPEQWGPREPGSEKPDTLGAAAAGPAPRGRRAPRAAGAAGGPRAGAAGGPRAGAAASAPSSEAGGAPNQPRSARRPDPSTVAPPPSSDSGDSAPSAGPPPPSSDSAPAAPPAPSDSGDPAADAPPAVSDHRRAGEAAVAEESTDMSKATGQGPDDAQSSPPQPGGSQQGAGPEPEDDQAAGGGDA